MRNSVLVSSLIALLILWGCGDHIPVDTDEPPPIDRPDFGEELFIPGTYYYDDGVQTFLLQSNRILSVLFDSTAANTQLQQVAGQFELRLFPGLEHPSEVDWDVEKRRTSLWVVPEDSLISEYYTGFPRTQDDQTRFGWHPLVTMAFPSYADQELINRYFIDDRFLGFTVPDIEPEFIEQYNETNNVEIVQIRTVEDMIEYTLRITSGSQRGTIEMANEYQLSQYFQSSFPDFILMDFNE